MCLLTDQREQSPRRLQRDLGLVADLLEILQREHQALMQNNLSALEDLLHTKQKTIADLERIDGLAGGSSHTELPNGCAAQPSTDAYDLWQQLSAVTVKCQEQNRLNGALLASRRRHAERALAILRGQPAENETYGPSGQAEFAPRPQPRVIA